MKKIQIIAPAYNESENLKKFVEEYKKLKINNIDLKLLIVDDGSLDDSETIIENLIKSNNDISSIHLSKNFGKEIAMTSAIHELNEDDYDALIFMDCDLQHPFKVVNQLVQEWLAGEFLVMGVRKNDEKKNLLKQISSKFFYIVMNKVSQLNLHSGLTDFCIMDKTITKEIKKFEERNRFFRGVIDWLGYDKKIIYFDAPQRKFGNAKYSFKKLIKLAVNSVTYYSNWPLKFIIYLGIFITLASSVSLIVILSDYFLNLSYNFSISAFVIVTNIFLSGIILISLGFVAIYVSSIFKEVISRPLYVVKKKRNMN